MYSISALNDRTVLRELGLHELQLFGWRVKSRAARDQSETERNQAAEIARLKRKVADQAEELAIVKMRPHTSPGA
jgi:transposase